MCTVAFFELSGKDKPKEAAVWPTNHALPASSCELVTSGAAPFVVTTTGHKGDPVVRVWTPTGSLITSLKVIDSVAAVVSQCGRFIGVVTVSQVLCLYWGGENRHWKNIMFRLKMNILLILQNNTLFSSFLNCTLTH